ncbi:hypothetical protein LCGC14_1105030 [marine sediment metagenome]|uniref:Uncharacterized protein n=1 Tax=marine sediment metagenome TaxID=412755 RepID=A0A0F9M8E5_9ZZZZ
MTEEKKPKPEKLIVLLPPLEYLKPEDKVKGKLIWYTGKVYTDGKFVYYLSVITKGGTKIIVRIGHSSGQMYRDFYELCMANKLPFEINIGISDGMKGRKIELG